MTKHVICIALEVDEKYSARDVKKEIEHGVQCFDSELFDTLGGVYVARNATQEYIVWNSEHISMLGFKVECYDDLVKIEEETQNSFSSWVTTNDIEGFVDAVNNEFNGTLEYQLRELA